MTKHIFFLLAYFIAAGFYSCKHLPPHDEAYIELRPVETGVGWGYEIYVDNKLYIKQDYIPVINGRHAFKTKEDAMLIGKIAFTKLESGKIPVITADELKQHNIRP